MKHVRHAAGLLRTLQFLLPAVITAVLVFTILPMTVPVLADVPERLELATTDTAETEKEIEENEEEPEAAVGDYTDGVYTGSAQGWGGIVEVQVTVEGGQIVDVTILSAAQETAAYLNRAMAVIDQVYLMQTWEVDVVSGATYTSNGILGAIQNALTGEVVENEAPAETTPSAPSVQESFTEPAAYKDGTYTGSAQGWGGTVTVSVTITDGKIAGLKVVNASGETQSYLNRAMAVVDRILDAGSPNVDAVSGATYTSNGIINATKRALNQAAADGSVQEDVVENETPNTENKPPVTEEVETVTGSLKDGTYTGSAMGFGGQITVSVTITDGKLSDLTVLDASAETPEYLDMAMAVADRIRETGSADVDVVSGATYTSNGIINATKRAMNQAVVNGGDMEEVEDTPPVQEPTPVLPEIDETVMPAEPLLDGVYTGTGDGWGGDIVMQVTVEGGRITAVEVLSAADETPAYFTRAESLIPYIISTQSTDVDVVSGATFSSEGILQGVDNALAQALETPVIPEVPVEPETPEEPEVDGLYADGTYSATGWCTDGTDGYFNYELTVTVTVSDGAVSEVAVARGTDLSEFPEDNDRYLDWAINGRTRGSTTYPGVPRQICDNQSADGVDAVSGATYTSESIMNLAGLALELAKLPGDADTNPETPDVNEPEAGKTPEETPDVNEPEAGETPEETPDVSEPEEESPEENPDSSEPEEETPEEPVRGPYIDGEYYATGWCYDEAVPENACFYYEMKVTVKVENGWITEIGVFTGEDLSEYPEDNIAYIDYAINGRVRKNVTYVGVPRQILDHQSADSVDVVSGATYTSLTIQELAAIAIDLAIVHDDAADMEDVTVTDDTTVTDDVAGGAE